MQTFSAVREYVSTAWRIAIKIRSVMNTPTKRSRRHLPFRLLFCFCRQYLSLRSFCHTKCRHRRHAWGCRVSKTKTIDNCFGEAIATKQGVSEARLRLAPETTMRLAGQRKFKSCLLLVGRTRRVTQCSTQTKNRES